MAKIITSLALIFLCACAKKSDSSPSEPLLCFDAANGTTPWGVSCSGGNLEGITALKLDQMFSVSQDEHLTGTTVSNESGTACVGGIYYNSQLNQSNLHTACGKTVQNGVLK